MIKSAVTINLIDTMSVGPWIFWHDLEESLKKAAGLGFDGVELFTGSGADLDEGYLRINWITMDSGSLPLERVQAKSFMVASR